MKRFCSVLVAFALCFGLLQPPKAQAVVLESGAISSLIGIVMSSMGYTWTASGMNEQGFGDALEDVIVEYLNTEVGGMTIEEWALVGTSVALSGNSTLLIQQGLMQKIMDFADWFTQKFGLDGGSSASVYSNDGGILLADGGTLALSSWSGGYKDEPIGGSCISVDSNIYFSTGAVLKINCENGALGSLIAYYDPEETQRAILVYYPSLQKVYFIFDGVDYKLVCYSPSANPPGYQLSEIITNLVVGSPASALDVGKSPTAQNPDIADDGTQAYELTIANLSASDLQELINAAVSQAIVGTLSVEGAVTDNPAVPDNPVVPDTGLLDSILTGVLAIPGAIVDGIVTALQSVFLPSDEAVQAMNAEVDAHFPFIGDLKDFGNDFAGVLANPAGSANNLTTIVDLGKKADGTYGSAKINLLDASWYLPYKDTGDDIIVGICWLVFLWNLYGALPNIIHGGASGLHSVARIEEEQSKRYWEDF